MDSFVQGLPLVGVLKMPIDDVMEHFIERDHDRLTIFCLVREPDVGTKTKILRNVDRHHGEFSGQRSLYPLLDIDQDLGQPDRP